MTHQITQYFVLVQNAVDDVKMLIVGNKVDLESERQVPRRKGEKVRRGLLEKERRPN